MLGEKERTLQHLTSNIIARSKELLAMESQETALYARSRERSRDESRWKSRGRFSSKERGRSSSREKITCFYCKKPGHLIKECRKLKYKEEQRNKDSGRESPRIAFMAINEEEKCLNDDEWVADSGSTLHITKNKFWLNNYKKLDRNLKIFIGNGSVVQAYGYGSVITDKLVIDNVYWVPSATANLFSISSATKNGFEVKISKDRLILADKEKVVLTGYQRCGVYVLNMKVVLAKSSNNQRPENCFVASTLECWHRKFGHVSHDTIVKMARNKSVNGLEISNELKTVCEECVKGKIHRCSHKASNTQKATKPGVIIHFDTVGPIRPESLGKARYFLLGKDEYSSFKFVSVIESKTSVKEEVIKIIKWSVHETSNDCVAIKTDNGSEFVNDELKNYLDRNSITHIRSAAYSPQQNGFIEREIRTVVESARTMLVKSKFELNLWGEAVACAVYVLNRCIMSRNNTQTPYELWYSKKPNVSNLRVFGEKAAIFDRNICSKFSEKGKNAKFVGYGKNFNTYRLYVEEIKKVVVTCDVNFLGFTDEIEAASSNIERQGIVIEMDDRNEENSDKEVNFDGVGQVVPKASTVISEEEEEVEVLSESESNDSSNKTTLISENNSNNQENGKSTNMNRDEAHLETILEEESRDAFYDTENGQENQPLNNIENSKGITINFGNSTQIHPKPTVSESTNFRMQSSPSKVTTRRVHFSDYDQFGPIVHKILLNKELVEEPTNYSSAMQRTDSEFWKAAMDEEIESLNKNKVWELIDKPKDKDINIVTCKWVFKLKRKSNGEIDRYKARLVARGFTQVEGIDYAETYSPVANMSTLRLLFGVVASNNYAMKGFDVKTAFLYGDLDEKVLMKQPEGYVENPDKVCLLRRSLYGLKQSPRMWNKKFSEFLLSTQLKVSENDQCVFYRNNPLVIICIYVDDGIIISNTVETVDEILKSLMQVFEIREVDLSSFIGFQIERNTNGIFIHQSNYISKILAKFNMENSKCVDSPVSQDKITDNSPLEEGTPYKEALGSLMYAAVLTRVDIMYAVCKASRYQLQPSVSNWQEIKRIFRYLNGTKDWGIWYKTGKTEIIGYCDADFAGDSETRRSTTGLVILLAGGSILWKSQRQRIVTLSSTEAELVGLCTLTQEIIWVRKLGIETNLIDNTPTRLLCDNQSAIKLSKNEKSVGRTRHMSVKSSFTREQIENKTIEISHVKAEGQIADMLTKFTTIKSFMTNRDKLMISKSKFFSLLSLLCLLTLVNSDEISGPILFRSTEKMAINKAYYLTFELSIQNPCEPNNKLFSIGGYNNATQIILEQLKENCNEVLKNSIEKKLKSLLNIDFKKPKICGLNEDKYSDPYYVWTETNTLLANPCNETQRTKGLCEPVYSAFNIFNSMKNVLSLREGLERLVYYVVQLDKEWKDKHEIGWSPWWFISAIRNIEDKSRILDSIISTVKEERRLNFSQIAIFTGVSFSKFYKNEEKPVEYTLIDYHSHIKIGNEEFRDKVVQNLLQIKSEYTEIEEITETSSGLKFKILVVVPSTDSYVLSVDPFKPLVQIGEYDQRMQYSGSKYVVYSRKCIYQIDDEVSECRFFKEKTCNRNTTARLYDAWESTNDNESYDIQTKEMDGDTYVYCYPKTIYVERVPYVCEKERYIKIPSGVRFHIDELHMLNESLGKENEMVNLTKIVNWLNYVSNLKGEMTKAEPSEIVSKHAIGKMLNALLIITIIIVIAFSCCLCIICKFWIGFGILKMCLPKTNNLRTTDSIRLAWWRRNQSNQTTNKSCELSNSPTNIVESGPI